VAFDDDPRWLYSIAMDSGQLQGLMVVTVTVHREAAPGQIVTPCKMVRWMIDPDYAAQMTATASTPAQGVTQ
jgi:hypothetical protein